MSPTVQRLVARLLEAEGEAGATDASDPLRRAKELLVQTPAMLNRAREASNITAANAATVDTFYSRSRTYTDGRPMKARRNGATRFWKTRPGEFRIPVKIGWKGYGVIDHTNAHEWATRPDFEP